MPDLHDFFMKRGRTDTVERQMYGQLKNPFAKMMKEQSGAYLDLMKGCYGDKLVEHIIDYFDDKEKREELYKLSSSLRVCMKSFRLTSF